jgi:hypothetical protein
MVENYCCVPDPFEINVNLRQARNYTNISLETKKHMSLYNGVLGNSLGVKAAGA